MLILFAAQRSYGPACLGVNKIVRRLAALRGLKANLMVCFSGNKVIFTGSQQAQGFSLQLSNDTNICHALVHCMIP